MSTDFVRLHFDELKALLKSKFLRAGLPDSHAEAVADH